MIKPLILFLTIVSGNALYAQDHKELSDEFAQTSSNQKFLSQHSLSGYKIYKIDKSFPDVDTASKINQAILSAEVGKVIGPFEDDSTISYIKVVKIDSAYRVRVGNIWIDVHRGKEEAKRIANQILSDVRKGSDYSTLCHIYSDDKNMRQDCDLGWIYNTIMVKEFGDEIIKHKLGEVFVVETQFGFHVVKILGQAYKDKKEAGYVVLKLKK